VEGRVANEKECIISGKERVISGNLYNKQKM